MHRRRVPIALAAFVVAAVAVVPAVQAALRPPTILPIVTPALGPGAGFGAAVDGIGDVDGDGVSDAVIGAPGAGTAFLISGATRTVLRQLADPDGLTATLFGLAVAGVGDVSGDGVEDVAVGAPSNPMVLPIPCPDDDCPDSGARGRAYVFSGATGAVLFKLTPAIEGYFQFGRSLTGRSDLSSDGVPDVVVGAPVLNHDRNGMVFAFSGADGSQLWSTTEPGPEQPLASFGRAVAEIPDVTGDGRADVLVSAIFSAYGSDLAGRVFLLSGQSGAIVRTTEDPAPVDDDAFGGLVSGTGDQDGDGRGDYLVGERGADTIHLYSGTTGALIRSLALPASSQDMGVLTIAHVGDMDGDGRDDFWVGVPAARRVFLLNGFGAVLASAAGPSDGGRFGAAVAPIGDIGGGPGPDLVVGDPDAPHGGAAYLVQTRTNQVPKAQAGPDQVLECGAPGGAPTILDGSASSDPDGDALSYEWRDHTGATVGTAAIVPVVAPLGTHVFTLRVTDALGDSDTDSVMVTVADTQAPSLSVTLTPTTLWPPNHQLVPISATVSVGDACDPSPQVRLASVTSSEADDGLGDGDTPGDIQGVTGGTDDRGFALRAERSGSGPGRVYAARFTATDGSDNTSDASVTVVVRRT